MRADLALVSRGFFASRAKAQEAIAAGLVRADGRLVRKPSETLAADAAIEAGAAYPYVSRGGVKLAAALDAFQFDPAGGTCLDVGASTGGFTDVLLRRGAAHVFAVDVGHDQLAMSLRQDPRVTSLEGTDARSLTAAAFDRPITMITCDTSFISLRLVLPVVLPLAAPGARIVALIKPQFEAGPAHVVKGLVKDEAVRQECAQAIFRLLQDAGWTIAGLIESPIAGGDGNREFLVGAAKS